MKTNHLRVLTAWALFGVLAMGVTGCSFLRKGWLDPTKTVDAAEAPSGVLPINLSVNPVDTGSPDYVPGSEPPTLADLEWSETNYQLGPGDVLNVSVLDLYAAGQETTFQRQVTNTGYIDVPLVPNLIKVGGLTVEQARRAIVNAYKPNILRQPVVSVVLVNRQQQLCSVMGAVARPGIQVIPRPDYRLLDALAAAGDVVQSNIRYIYVIRLSSKAGELAKPATQAGAPAAPAPLTPSALPPLPGQQGTQPATAPSAEQKALQELQKYMPSGQPLPMTEPAKPAAVRLTELAQAGGKAPATSAAAAGWQVENGQWVFTGPSTRSALPTQPSGQAAPGRVPGVGAALPRVPSESPAPARTQVPAAAPGVPVTTTPTPEDPYGWAQADLSDMSRVIRIDLKKLKQGDFRQNIIIHNRDIINVPIVQQSEFYVTGEVNRPGVFTLNNKRITLKMAIAAAGGLGPLAWPSNSVLVRRVSDNDEIMVPINLDLIMQGKEPDIMLKPDDVIAVGSNAAAPFLAVIRNAFRITYGFGFIYDRNFAEKNLGQFQP